MARVYREADVGNEITQKKTAILGFGSQGHAHALNLKDSGCEVSVGLYEGSKSWPRAEEAGLQVMTIPEAVRWADVVMMLLPDEKQPPVFRDEVGPNLSEGDLMLFAHGFNIHFNQIVVPPEVDLGLVAPKGPGHVLRRLYVEGKGMPSLFAVENDASGQARDVILSYARAIGSGRAGIIETTFAEETETDLFGEQAVLCGGLSALLKAGFETLVEAGYQPELAYYECVNELKLIVDLIYEGGLAGMRYSISNTAEYGDYTAGPRLIDESVKERMRGILADIQSGKFAKDWVLENGAGLPGFLAMRRREAELRVEKVGAELRGLPAEGVGAIPGDARPQLRHGRLRGHPGVLERGQGDLAGPQDARALRALREVVPDAQDRPAALRGRALRHHARDTRAQRPEAGHLHQAARLQGRRVSRGEP